MDIDNAAIVVTSKSRAEVYRLIDEERNRQEDKWGAQTHPNGTSQEYAWIADAYRESCELATREGRLTWHDILVEEVFEALAEEGDEALEYELIQAIAVAVNWVEDLRRKRRG